MQTGKRVTFIFDPSPEDQVADETDNQVPTNDKSDYSSLEAHYNEMQREVLEQSLGAFKGLCFSLGDKKKDKAFGSQVQGVPKWNSNLEHING